MSCDMTWRVFAPLALLRCASTDRVVQPKAVRRAQAMFVHGRRRSSVTTTDLSVQTGSHKWQINRFSLLDHQKNQALTSDVFDCAGQKWRLKLYPVCMCVCACVYVFVCVCLCVLWLRVVRPSMLQTAAVFPGWAQHLVDTHGHIRALSRRRTARRESPGAFQTFNLKYQRAPQFRGRARRRADV